MKKWVLVAALLAVGGSVLALKAVQFNGKKMVSITTSTSGDSTYVKDTIWLVGDAKQYRSYIVRVVVGAAASTKHGFGNKDTARIVLKSRFSDMYYTLDSVLRTSIPCTLLTAKILNDTLLKEDLGLFLYMADTCSDTVQTTAYPVKWDVIAKE